MASNVGFNEPVGSLFIFCLNQDSKKCSCGYFRYALLLGHSDTIPPLLRSWCDICCHQLHKSCRTSDNQLFVWLLNERGSLPEGSKHVLHLKGTLSLQLVEPNMCFEPMLFWPLVPQRESLWSSGFEKLTECPLVLALQGCLNTSGISMPSGCIALTYKKDLKYKHALLSIF